MIIRKFFLDFGNVQIVHERNLRLVKSPTNEQNSLQSLAYFLMYPQNSCILVTFNFDESNP